MKNKIKKIHIIVIILGIAFILIPAFHSGLWFDESYSVAIAKHNIIDIWKITGNDVHPALYYWMLHIVFLIFGNSVIAYRLFSVLAIAILGILGYTHIRKDFGEKVGLFFSFLVYFLPVMNSYAQEIRMYSWSCLIVTLMAIYGYRLYQNLKNSENINKNLVVFGIFSICCCYIHYYALVATCLVNLILLIYLIRNKEKDPKSLKQFIILAVIQVALYIPWLIYFVGQLMHVGGGFWISLKLVDTSVEGISFQFRRQLDSVFTLDLKTIICFVVAVAIYAYIGYKIYKAKKEEQNIKPGLLAVAMYFGVVAIILVISIILPIFYSRYLMVITGFYIFALAYILSTEKKKIVTFIICGVILIMGIISNAQNVIINYDSSNVTVVEYIQDEIQDDDIIIYSNIGNGGVIAAYFPEYKQYFLNFDYWDVEEAYKAYGPGMETVTSWDFLEDYTGRIWLIDSESMGLYDALPKDDITILKEAERLDTKYHDYIYNIMLVEKK